MQTLIMVAQLLLSLSILVFIHELGHFLAAKMFKTRVDKFYLFFDFMFPLPNVLNFALFKKKIGETEYGLGWFPLGGYVSIAGMVDETTDKDSLSAEPQPWEYRSKKGWQKMIIILGGIIFNLIFAVMIYTALLFFAKKEYLPASSLKDGGVLVSEKAKELGFKDGDVILTVNGQAPVRFEDLLPISVLFGGEYKVSRMENGVASEKTIKMPANFYKKFKGDMFAPFYQNLKVESVIAGSNAEKGGLKNKDLILNTKGSVITSFDQFKNILDSSKGQQIQVSVLRNNEAKELTVNVDSTGKIGFMPGFELPKDKYKMQHYGFFESMKYGTNECVKLFTMQAISISKMVTREMDFKENVGGPIAMAKGFGVEWDWYRFWLFTAMISVGLAFMNLLPIPALDGGHAVVILIEMITGKPVNEKVLQFLQNVGTIIILGLMVFVFYNDLTRK